MVEKNSGQVEMDESSDYPYFYKLMFITLNSEKLRIPPNFVKHILNDLDVRATLLDPSGNRCSVTVDVSGSNIYLQDGWQEFIRENSLGDNEFLLFTYEGHMCFRIEVFDATGLKRSASAGQASLKKKRGRPGKDASNEEESRAWRKAKSFVSENPYVPVPMTYSLARACPMHFQSAFAKAHLPDSDTEMLILNQNGEVWYAQYKMRPNKYHCLSSGWRSFMLANNILVGDICILELIGETKFQVHVIDGS